MVAAATDSFLSDTLDRAGRDAWRPLSNLAGHHT